MNDMNASNPECSARYCRRRVGPTLIQYKTLYKHNNNNIRLGKHAIPFARTEQRQERTIRLETRLCILN